MDMNTAIAALLGGLLVGGVVMVGIGIARFTSYPQGNPQACGQEWTIGSSGYPAVVALMASLVWESVSWVMW